MTVYVRPGKLGGLVTPAAAAPRAATPDPFSDVDPLDPKTTVYRDMAVTEAELPPVGLTIAAKEISYDPASSGLLAENVQDAIDELDGRVDGAELDLTELLERVVIVEGKTGPANTDAPGIIELATQAEVMAGDDAVRAVTPATLQIKLDSVTGSGPATEVQAGIAEIATQAETDAGLDDTRIVSPLKLAPLAGRVTAAEAGLATAQGDIIALDSRLSTAEANITTLQGDVVNLDGRLDAAEASIANHTGRINAAELDIDALQAADVALDGRLDAAEASIVTLTGKTGPASEAAAGIAELATTAEVTAGADDLRIVTPLKLAQRLAALPALPGAATEATAGIAELATAAEVNAGADDARIITPLKLRNFNGKIAGQVTIGGGAASASIQSVSTAGSVEFGFNNGTRAYKIWMAAASSLLTIRDETAGADRVKLDSAGGVAIGGNAASGALLTVTNPAGYTQLSIVAGGTDQQARLDIVNSTRYWTLFSQANALHFYDITGGRERGSVDLNGVWKLNGNGTPANYAFLNVYGDQGCQINVETTGATVAGVIFKNGTANVWTLQNGGDGAFRLYRGGTQIIGVDSSSDCYFANSGYFAGAVSAPGALIGGEGNAGRLKCFNTANYVTFSWSGTQLFARIDNGGAVVALN